jgi:hypothetical protein
MDQYLDPLSLVTPAFPEQYTILYWAQRLLGPDSLMYGFFHAVWVTIQDDYLRFRNLPRNKNPSLTMMKLLSTTLFNALHKLWLLRNSHLHDSNGTSLHSYKQHSQLLQEIASLYDQAPSMLASDRSIFQYPLEKQQTHNTNQLRNFLSFARPMVQISAALAKDMGHNFRSIDEYFQPVIPQNTSSTLSWETFAATPIQKWCQIRLHVCTGDIMTLFSPLSPTFSCSPLSCFSQKFVWPRPIYP